jgi:hypothetical protein
MRAKDLAPDPCSQPYPLWSSRAAVLTLCFLTMIFGSIAVYSRLENVSLKLQAATVVGETAAAILYTFSKNRGNPPYLYSCPIVQSQFPTLIRRHLLFLLGIVILETVDLRIQPYVSTWWLTSTRKDETPINVVLAILVGIVAIVEILTNRSLLARAHAKDANA